jgi:DNA-binding Lrp family transcriptional regulator
MLIELDQIDRKILTLIQADARRPADLIGGEIGL